MYSTEILLNTATIREVNLIEMDSNLTERGKQPSKLSQLQNTQLNLLTVTFLAILKQTEINLRRLIVDGRVKKAKD